MIDKLAVIGAGNWGRNLLRNFCELLGAQRVVCCDLDEKILQRAERAYPGLTICVNPNGIWEDDHITAAVIATPSATHYELAKQALRADKHVFVEKPLALNSKEAEALCRLAEDRQRLLMVDHLLLYHPAVKELIKRVRAGELGHVHYVYSQRVNLGVVRTEENALWSLGPHDIAVILELIGAEPLQVLAQGGIYLQKEKKIEDVVFLTMAFPCGELAHLHLSWLDPHKLRKITVVGSEKMIVFDDMEPQEKLKIYDKGVTVQPPNASLQVRYGDIIIPNVPLREPLRAACQHFLNCIEQGQRPRSDGWAGLQVIRVLEAAQRSLEHGGKPVMLLQGVKP